MGTRRPAPTDLHAVVTELDRGDLEAILETAAARHEDVASAVRLAGSRTTGHLGQLRTEIDRALRTRRFLDYYESGGWAMQAAPIVDEIRAAAAKAPSEDLVALIERAVGHVVKVILHADDSDGMIGDLARELLDVHAETCDAGVADPLKLARWMVRFGFEDQDFFMVDPVRYASALGEFGLAAYRREVRQRRDAKDRSFAVAYAEERLAVLDGDVDTVIRLLGGDLTRPHQFIQVAQAMEELGRDDDVLTWAGRGIAETEGWQVAQLYDLAATVHMRRSDAEALLRLRRDEHHRIASTKTYNFLRVAAEPTGVWTTERPGARSVLAGRDLSALVDVLLADGEPDVAWQVAVDNPEWNPGGRRWMALAEAREPSRPDDALDVYLRLADTELEMTGRAAYSRAVAILKKAARAAVAAGRTAQFAEHLQMLRDRHRRRPTLIALFDKAGLP